MILTAYPANQGNFMDNIQSSTAFSSNTKKPLKCWICQELEHGKWEFPKKIKEKGMEKETSSYDN